jgi:hypothetical protein
MFELFWLDVRASPGICSKIPSQRKSSEESQIPAYANHGPSLYLQYMQSYIINSPLAPFTYGTANSGFGALG